MMMKPKFAKAIAENITTIAGNVARVALIDEGQLGHLGEDGRMIDRVECCQRIEKAKKNIAALLQQPGSWQS